MNFASTGAHLGTVDVHRAACISCVSPVVVGGGWNNYKHNNVQVQHVHPQTKFPPHPSGVARIGAKGALDSEKMSKIGKKRGKLGKGEEKLGKNWEKVEKSGRKGQNRKGSFTLPLLTNRAGYTTATPPSHMIRTPFTHTAQVYTQKAQI